MQDALSADEDPSEIWVAKGIYYPDVGRYQVENDENSTFVLRNGITLYGGFDTNDTNINVRDWEKNLTILSGDIDENDITDANGVVTNADGIVGYNADNVLYTEGTTGSTVLDGFTMTAGQTKNMSACMGKGGGFHCNGSGKGNECSPTLRNIIFSGNMSCDRGGAMYNNGRSGGKSNPTLINVTFSGNSGPEGEAMYNNAFMGISSPKLINVVFSGNSASHGGAMYNYCECPASDLIGQKG